MRVSDDVKLVGSVGLGCFLLVLGAGSALALVVWLVRKALGL